MFDVVVIADKGKTQQRVRCMIKQCTIGKSRDNLVQIRGLRIAPVHCRVEMTDKGIYIEDTSDGIGTSVNGNKVNYYGPLRSNDVIGIGAYEFRIGTAVGEGIEEGRPLAAIRRTCRTATGPWRPSWGSPSRRPPPRPGWRISSVSASTCGAIGCTRTCCT